MVDEATGSGQRGGVRSDCWIDGPRYAHSCINRAHITDRTSNMHAIVVCAVWLRGDELNWGNNTTSPRPSVMT